MASNYSNMLYRDYEKVCNKLDTVLDKLSTIEKEHKKEIKELKKDFAKERNELKNAIQNLQKINEKLLNENNDLKKEILRMKSKNDRDSCNSSKPSSTNGYKKVKTNNREKSSKKQGAQPGHKAHSLNNKLEQFINSGDIEEQIIEINKNKKNRNKRYIEKIVIDIKITKVVKRYRYYPDKHGKYNIPQYHNQNIQYGSFIKAMSIDLMNHLPNSTDGVTRFIEDITNGGITLSKGTLVLWNEDIAVNDNIRMYKKRKIDMYKIVHKTITLSTFFLLY